jgi:hypothetical protein
MLLRTWMLAFLVASFPFCAVPCTRGSPVSSSAMVRQADVIARVVALEYAMPPSNPNVWTTGVPDSTIRFHVEEVIRGDWQPDLVLPGYLVDRDDFNDHPSPYNFVRPGGRRGSCFANSYRKGAQFLLFLKKKQSGELTVNWYALGPVNEQLHSDNDPWLLWVREQAPKKTEDIAPRSLDGASTPRSVLHVQSGL